MRTIEWQDGIVRMIDQTRLPQEFILLEYVDYRDVAEAIKTMKIRGAPAIGAAAAFGIALAALHARSNARTEVLAAVARAAETIGKTRPTAVNLFWAIRRMTAVAYDHRWTPESKSLGRW